VGLRGRALERVAWLRGVWGILGRLWGQRAGQVEEALVLLLHL